MCLGAGELTLGDLLVGGVVAAWPCPVSPLFLRGRSVVLSFAVAPTWPLPGEDWEFEQLVEEAAVLLAAGWARIL